MSGEAKDAKEGKKHIAVCVAGHVDAGKSTTTGRLIFELGGLSQREMEKLQQKADEMGKGSFGFAFFCDSQKAEQERGITIACNTKEFYTDKYHYSIVDAPGHRDFIKNFLTGSAQTSSAILMVPAENFIVAMAKGNKKAGEVQGQTRQHALLLNLLGIKQLIVCINKMDAVGYSQDKYNEVAEEVKNMLKAVGWPKLFVDKSVPIIPLSGFKGDNLTKKSENMDWWKGQDLMFKGGRKVHVETLYGCLNDMVVEPPRKRDAPLRLPVSGVYNIKGVGDVITGVVEQGVVKPNDEVVFLPTHTSSNPCTGKVFTVEMHHKRYELGDTGDNIGMNVKGLDKKNMPQVGDVMILKKDDTLKTCKEFTAQVQMLEVSGDGLKVGYTPVAYVKTNRAAVKLSKINWKMGKETGGTKMENPASLKTGDTAEVVFEPSSNTPFVVEPFTDSNNPEEENCLGRVAIMEGHSLQMMGKVVSYVPK